MSDIIIDSILHKNDFLTLETRDKIRGIQAELTKLREDNNQLAKAIEGIIKVADRKTNEFDFAKEALAKHKQSDEKGG